MKHASFLAAILLVVFVVPAGIYASGVDRTHLERLHAVLQESVEKGELPGAVLLIAHRGKIVSLRAVGLSDIETKRAMKPDSIFRLASATKILTSVALLRLYEQGRFGLRDAVSDYLPEFKNLTVQSGTAMAPAKRTLTIRDLLRHTSGYGYGYEDPQQTAYREAGILHPGEELNWSHNLTLAEWVTKLTTVPLADEPGTKFDYGFSSDIIGYLIERLSGQPLDRFMEEQIFRMLQMDDTGFMVPVDKLDRLTSIYEIENGKAHALDRASNSALRKRPRAFSGGGGWDNLGNNGLVSSAPDMFRFLQMLLNKGNLDGTSIISRKTVEMMWQNQLSDLDVPDSMWPGVGFGFGYAFLYDSSKYGGIDSPGTIWWAGSTNVHYWVDPHEQLIGVLMLQVRPFPYLDLMGKIRHLSFLALE